MSWSWIWGQISYIFALLISTFMVSFQMPKRDRFAVRVLICCAVITAYKMLIAWFLVENLPQDIRIYVDTTISFLLYLFTCAGVWICFDCDFYAALFCGTVGYCLQHISQRIYVIIGMHAGISGEVPRELLLTGVTAAVYLAAYFTLVRRNRFRSIMVDNQRQLIVATIVVMVTIFLHSFALRYTDSLIVVTYIFLFSILIAFLGMLYEFNMVASKNSEFEKDTIARMMEDERKQYYFEKSMIEFVNIKSHDLKHYLDTNKSIPEKEAEEIRRAIRSREIIFETGSEALDVVLARKAYTCMEKDIRFTCLADGKCLSFMEETDVYSLFGNLIDNAIEAVEKVPEKNDRIISVTVSENNHFVLINVVNYYSGHVAFNRDGLPRTTKDDRAAHGFGMYSIRRTVEKYDGDLRISTEGGNFTVDIMFCR